jgi:hypothetical protein
MSEGSSPMKKLLFGAVIAMMIVNSLAVAYATPGDNWADRPWLEGECKWCPSWRSPASSGPPPWWLTPSRAPVCHLVKERVGTHNGHAVYRTLQVC